MGQKINPFGFASALTVPGTAAGSLTTRNTASSCMKT